MSRREGAGIASERARKLWTNCNWRWRTRRPHAPQARPRNPNPPPNARRGGARSAVRRVHASRRGRAYEAGRPVAFPARPIPDGAAFGEFILGESRLFVRGVEPDLENWRAALDSPGIALPLEPEEPPARADHRIAVGHRHVGLGHGDDAGAARCIFKVELAFGVACRRRASRTGRLQATPPTTGTTRDHGGRLAANTSGH